MSVLLFMLLVTSVIIAQLEYVDYYDSLSFKIFYRLGFLILTAIILGIYYFIY